ncbi:MAG TPA: helix-turn-helix domain-containing protein [Longimicrobiales bacterium]|nr:helix-turn-helix domain-containing protein [Longimicrobiales bacterium]
MTVLERLRQLADALPFDHSAVTFTRADLFALLEGEGEARSIPERDLTVEEVAAEVGRAVSTVRGWLASGELKGYKLNRRDWRVPRAALRAYLERQPAGADRSREPAADAEVDISAWRKVRQRARGAT